MSAVRAIRFDDPPIGNDWSLAFAHPLTRAASDYWERCRGERAMPRAEDLAPKEMKAFLARVSLLDVCPRRQGGSDFRVRLAGDETRRVFGDIAKKFLHEFLPPQGEQRWRLAFEAVCTRKKRVRSHGTVSFAGKEWLEFESLVAPLGSDGQVSGLFTVFVSGPRIGP